MLQLCISYTVLIRFKTHPGIVPVSLLAVKYLKSNDSLFLLMRVNKVVKMRS